MFFLQLYTSLQASDDSNIDVLAEENVDNPAEVDTHAAPIDQTAMTVIPDNTEVKFF